VQDEPKEYEAVIRFGIETDTDDVTGTPLRTASTPAAAAVVDAVAALTGDLEQTPPAFSAKHVAGKRAYRLARAGASPELRPVHVRVDGWQILDQTTDALRARIVCSGGTYIRALARDLGRLTNSAAHCAELRRVRSGPFRVDDAVLPDAVTSSDIRPALAAIAGLPTQTLDAEQALGVAHGRPAGATVAGEWAALVRDETELLAVAERQGDQWHPRVVIADSEPS
jgi:tRNA pseudouridine55 synthase